MIKTITKLGEYRLEPKLMTSDGYKSRFSFLGNNYYFADGEWMRHIHIKITDACDAKCSFCIEDGSRVKSNINQLLMSTSYLLSEMERQMMLKSVSITGGEPTTHNKLQLLFDLLHEYSRRGTFTTINTHGRNILNSKLVNWPTYINISKHSFNDSEIFGLHNLTLYDLREIKNKTKRSLRLQCVLETGGLNNVEDIIRFIRWYQKDSDSLSFRGRMRTKNYDPSNDILIDLKRWLLNNAKFIYQQIQDYYSYESWKYNGKEILLSQSDMKMLGDSEKVEDNNILREIIIHPDGLISGDWSRTNKVIFNPILT